MQHRHLAYWLGMTDDLSDAEFEQIIGNIRAMRQIRTEAIAHERAMIGSMGEVYLRHVEASSPAEKRRALIASYAANGLTEREIDSRLRELKI